MANRSNFDPFKSLPTAAALRRRLKHLQEQNRKLAILLKMTERIERESRSVQDRPGGDHAANR